MEDVDKYVRVTLVGDSKSGKSNFMHQFCNKKTNDISIYNPSGIEKDFKIVKSGEKKIKINLLEIGSQFQSHSNETIKIQGTCFMYSLSNAFLLFYSNQSNASLTSISIRLEDLRRHSTEKTIYIGKFKLKQCISIYSNGCVKSPQIVRRCKLCLLCVRSPNPTWVISRETEERELVLK